MPAAPSPPAHPAYAVAPAPGPERGRWVVTCDHASNAVPDWVARPDLGGALGLPPEDMGRHIALDVGAEGLALALGRRLRAPVLLARFSRLVIDANRGEDDPTLVMRLYDGSVIPANRRVTPDDIAARLDRLHRPYHDALATLMVERPGAALLAVHSFTPRLRGRPPRPWQVGVLHSHLDGRLARPLIARLGAEGDLVVGDNQPYDGHLPGDSVDRHALASGRPNVLVELRNDLIGTPEAQESWGQRLAGPLEAALDAMEER